MRRKVNVEVTEFFPTLFIGYTFFSKLNIFNKISLAKFLVDYLVYLCQLLICSKMPSLTLIAWAPKHSLTGPHPGSQAPGRLCNQYTHILVPLRLFSDLVLWETATIAQLLWVLEISNL